MDKVGMDTADMLNKQLAESYDRYEKLSYEVDNLRAENTQLKTLVEILWELRKWK